MFSAGLCYHAVCNTRESVHSEWWQLRRKVQLTICKTLPYNPCRQKLGSELLSQRLLVYMLFTTRIRRYSISACPGKYVCTSVHTTSSCLAPTFSYLLQVAVSIANHLQDLPDSIHSVKVGCVSNPTKENLTAAWKQWIQSAGACTLQLVSHTMSDMLPSCTCLCHTIDIEPTARITQCHGVECQSAVHH